MKDINKIKWGLGEGHESMNWVVDAETEEKLFEITWSVFGPFGMGQGVSGAEGVRRWQTFLLSIVGQHNADLERESMLIPPPAPGQIWRNVKNERLYMVLSLSESKSDGQDGERKVIYIGTDGHLYDRRTEEFMMKFTYEPVHIASEDWKGIFGAQEKP